MLESMTTSNKVNHFPLAYQMLFLLAILEKSWIIILRIFSKMVAE